jgi:hypothetical protein
VYPLEGPILATKLNGLGLPRPSRRYGSTRVCEAAECGTVLSSYNRGQRCWFHQPLRFPISSMTRRMSQPATSGVGATISRDRSQRKEVWFGQAEGSKPECSTGHAQSNR